MDLTGAVLSFAVVAGLLTITPGLDTALVLRAAVNAGRRPAFFTAVGICLGALTWGASAAVGVSALLAASDAAYPVLRIAGAGYMLFLGVRMIWSAARGGGHDPAPATSPRPATTPWAALGRGALTNLLNPKVGAFYVAVLPQFIPAGSSHLAVGVLLASVHGVEGMLWFTAIIFGARALSAFLKRRTAQRAVDGVTGAVIVGFGVKLGLSSRW